MILARVRRTSRERGLFTRGARVIVACSGGPDSQAMLHVLSRLAPELSLELCAASVDHGLRSGSEADVEVARALARSLGVPFVALRVAIERGPSVQAAARRARYEALHAEARRAGARTIAVGHTLDDQAETVLSRLLRGGGALGLAAIDPKRADGVVRPLIDCRREEVRAYVARHTIAFATDPSNSSERFERVRVRGAVVPPLVAEEPRVLEHLATIADDARALREMVELAADALFPRVQIEAGRLDAQALAIAPAPVRAAVWARWVRALTSVTASRAHLASLEATLSGDAETLLPGDVRVRREEDRVVARHAPLAPTRSRRARVHSAPRAREHGE